MVSVYQIGLILILAVSVLSSALVIAWRDVGRGSGRRREARRHDNRRWRRRWARNSDRVRDREAS
jgi:hypothetical protein